MNTLTHDDLVLLAAEWLRNNGHFVVGAEVKSSKNKEEPDAIGWKASGFESTVIECKASVADFHADKKKEFRQNPKSGMGLLRYFLTPHGLVGLHEIPKGWGLLCVMEDGRISQRKPAEIFKERDMAAEFAAIYQVAKKGKR